jgi:hypothetical protein
MAKSLEHHNRKVPVSERALIQRVNRALKKDLRAVKIPRGLRMRQEAGAYYLLDLNRNWIVKTYRRGLRLESLARELGVLEAWETLEPSTP